MPPILWILASVLLTVIAQIFLKFGTRKTGPLGGNLFSVLFEKYIWIWALLNALALVLYLAAIARVDLSYAYPFIALGYVLIPTLSIYLFRERVRPRQWLGIIIICFGVILIALN